MITRTSLRSMLRMTIALGALAVLGVAAHAQQVSITPTVSFSNGLYTYEYSVMNNTLDRLAITTFEVRPLPNAVMMPTAPAGFGISFDPGPFPSSSFASGVGLVSFFEDDVTTTLGTFDPGSTISGFMFTSPFAPTVSNFEALDINGVSFLGTTLAPANVPEPGTIAFAVTLSLGLAGMVKTRRTKAVR